MSDEIQEAKERLQRLEQRKMPLDWVKVTMGQCEKNPQLIIDMLKASNGDVEKLATQLSATTTRRDSKERTLMYALLILNKPENLAFRQQWDALITAYKQAKIAMAERTAFEWIGSYEPPDEKVTVQTAVAFMRLWMGEHINAQNTLGRIKAAETPPAGYSEDTAGSILGQLQKEDS
jgi:hypothetical protein